MFLRNYNNLLKKNSPFRYVILRFWNSSLAYNDARRLRKSDGSCLLTIQTYFDSVPFVLVNGPNPPYPERMPYATNELNSNENAPAEDPGIFTKTEVNR